VQTLSRRAWLASSGGALLGACAGCRVEPATRNEQPENEAPQANAPARPQRVIDVHLHANFADATLRRQGETLSRIDFSPAGLATLMDEAHVEQAISIGFETERGELSRTAENPMGLGERETWGVLARRLRLVGGINPRRLDETNLDRIDQALAAKEIIGLKIYLGYYPVAVDDPVYLPLYNLAAKHDVPVVLHTGDTYSENAKVRFAHPLLIDDVAVDHRDTRFVIAHLGNPWTIDAAELLYKNKNVYGDLSGFLVGDREYFAQAGEREGIEHAVDRIRRAFAWVANPRKFLFGSDWPLVPIAPYIDFICRAIDAQHRERVFFENAREVFRLDA
jgi:predicted TIM-barrel fold metal-dependent hydrolase